MRISEAIRRVEDAFSGEGLVLGSIDQAVPFIIHEWEEKAGISEPGNYIELIVEVLVKTDDA